MEYYLGDLSNEMGTYQLFWSSGFGTKESPRQGEKIIRTIECSYMDAFIIANYMNIEKHGFMHKRTSWESPLVDFRKLEIEK